MKLKLLVLDSVTQLAHKFAARLCTLAHLLIEEAVAVPARRLA